jgi:hypothetical protein
MYHMYMVYAGFSSGNYHIHIIGTAVFSPSAEPLGVQHRVSTEGWSATQNERMNILKTYKPFKQSCYR